MIEHEIQVPPMIDGPQLLDEIESAVGHRPSSVTRKGSVAVLTFEDSSVDVIEVDRVIAGHVPPEIGQLDALVAKAQSVLNGTGTFTMAQSQKILAGLVLVVARRLR